jgi:hypothetical protein
MSMPAKNKLIKKSKKERSQKQGSESEVKPFKTRHISYVRLLLLIVTFIIVGSAATLTSYYARGWRFNSESGDFKANGILVLKSVPDSAQILINGELKTATNTQIPLLPGTYDITLKKDGYMDWNKRLTIDKEVVTESTAYLFRSAPSLSSMTFSGVSKLIPSNNLTKIAYVVPPTLDPLENEKSGLWVMEFLNLPIGFSREPRRITDGDITDATWVWSPEDDQILLTTKTGVFLLNVSNYTSQSQRINISATKDEILENWKELHDTKLKSQLAKLPLPMQDILTRKAKSVVFAPDEKMVLYTASASSVIEDTLIPELPGSSTQKQERNIKENQTYVYDIEEDRNFLVDETSADLAINNDHLEYQRRMSWFPTSRHLVLAEKDKIVIMDYDATNKKTIYSGSYVAPHAYPSLNSDRLLILTNLGAGTTFPNLYSISLR